MKEIHAPLVSCETLFENLEDWVVFDCRHDLLDAKAGPKAYAKAHIPGAFHAHIDRDLSGPVGSGQKGRHPLPIAFQRLLQVHGVNEDTQIVAYDDAGGMWAARLWWLAKHHGHEAVAVLDGGLPRWKELGLPLSSGHEKPRAHGNWTGTPGKMPTVDMAAVESGSYTLLDARLPERYSGEVEPIDPMAGHIPGALNHPFTRNLEDHGMFRSPDELRAMLEDYTHPATYCGSGVTAAHNVLAFEVADLSPPALYPGSWSEWCARGGPVEVANDSEE